MPEVPTADHEPMLSLVVATVDRVDEVQRLFASLLEQEEKRFEVFVVDQNPDDRITTVLNDAQASVPVTHLRSARGLSRARNLALPHVRGRIVAFPDDDCWYPPDLLRRVMEVLDVETVDGLAVRAELVGDGSAFGAISTGREPAWLDGSNAVGRTISYTTFLRSHVVRRVGGFDEDLGLGADSPWWSGEDTDYVLRALAAGFRIRYEPGLEVFHPPPPRGMELLERAYRYGLGMGRVWRKHDYPLSSVLYGLARPIAGAIRSGLAGDAEGIRFYLNSVRGRLQGWRHPA